MKRLTVKMVEQLSFFLAQEFMAYDEPIPDFYTRFPNILESCLASPFQWFSGRPLYRGFVSKASVLFYLMLKNHPFQNGNKRLAIMILLFASRPVRHRSGTPSSNPSRNSSKPISQS